MPVLKLYLLETLLDSIQNLLELPKFWEEKLKILKSYKEWSLLEMPKEPSKESINQKSLFLDAH
jgi:hypothetical protein